MDLSKYLTRLQINEVFRTKDFKKMTCCLMTTIFTLRQMTTCLVTGKCIKVEDAKKPLMDQEKVQFIVGVYKFWITSFGNFLPDFYNYFQIPFVNVSRMLLLAKSEQKWHNLWHNSCLEARINWHCTRKLLRYTK